MTIREKILNLLSSRGFVTYWASEDRHLDAVLSEMEKSGELVSLYSINNKEIGGNDNYILVASGNPQYVNWYDGVLKRQPL